MKFLEPCILCIFCSIPFFTYPDSIKLQQWKLSYAQFMEGQKEKIKKIIDEKPYIEQSKKESDAVIEKFTTQTNEFQAVCNAWETFIAQSIIDSEKQYTQFNLWKAFREYYLENKLENNISWPVVNKWLDLLCFISLFDFSVKEALNKYEGRLITLKFDCYSKDQAKALPIVFQRLKDLK